eukprot:3611061-Prymnesium_polylepis.1
MLDWLLAEQLGPSDPERAAALSNLVRLESQTKASFGGVAGPLLHDSARALLVQWVGEHGTASETNRRLRAKLSDFAEKISTLQRARAEERAAWWAAIWKAMPLRTTFEHALTVTRALSSSKSVRRRRAQDRRGSAPTALKSALAKCGSLPMVALRQKLLDLADGTAEGLAEALRCERVLLIPVDKASPSHVTSTAGTRTAFVCSTRTALLCSQTEPRASHRRGGR